MKFNFNSSTYVRKGLHNFAPKAQCDVTGFAVNHTDLVAFHEWGGNTLYNTGLLMHKEYVDSANPRGKTPIIYHDPTPVLNARPVPPSPPMGPPSKFAKEEE